MTQDARFEDGVEEALRLRAETEDDLAIISSLVQDAVFPASEMQWISDRLVFAVLINRFRWEDKDAASAQGRGPERVQSLLMVDCATKVQSSGIAQEDKDTVYSLLSISFEAEKEGAGRVVLHLAGEGDISVVVEALEVRLKDVTKPYTAPSKKSPSHDL